MARADWRAAFNARALERLLASTPDGFPQAVWRHALASRLLPETPGRAVASYWNAHPVRADRLARGLARVSGAPPGWVWEVGRGGATFRTPPTPYREERWRLGPGVCCICGQPVFRFGWHRDLTGGGPSRRAGWHAACVAAWKLWRAPHAQARVLKRLQGRRCAATAGRLRRDAEVDHRVPLFQVWRDHRDRPWPELLDFWGIPNLQVVNRGAHRLKCAGEARERASRRIAGASTGSDGSPARAWEPATHRAAAEL